MKQVNGYVIQKNKNGFILQTDDANVFVFWKNDIKLFSQINITDSFNDIDINKLDLNFKNYLISKDVFFLIKAKELNSNTNNFKSIFFSWIESKGMIFSSYIKALIFSINISDNNLKNSLKALNILHLFVISGFHISILTKCFNLIFKKIKYNNEISIFILIVYCYFIDFPIPITRALLIMIITHINKNIFHNSLNKFSIVLISMQLFLIFNIFNIYSISFILTYYFTIFTTIFSSIKIKSKIIKTCCFILLISLLSFFINIKLNSSFSSMLLLNNIIFGIIFSVIYPILFFSWIIIPFSKIIINCVDFLIKFSAKFNYAWNINYDLSIVIIIICISIFFILLYFCYKSNKPKFWVLWYL
ncbi:MAG0480 family ComEC-like protein [Mycoplasma phocimorsus]|uniref:MAG0480 family ComEC-like protein n=1 Tax=Mycoplasma phocimorsus TaxID=3045839 RepID=UPI0024C0C885|nr:ComEC/Rec2 family competence protein [Mycoplasma phocimorsus]MDJ1646258.1 ComEC/Rec2 family competence protein [Mycoplasma phocimorsus]